MKTVKCTNCANAVKIKPSREKRCKTICCGLKCANQLKVSLNSGRNNPNCQYKNLDDNFFADIDTEAKAYLLGWIAGDGHISKIGFRIQIHEKDIDTLNELKDIICSDLKIATYKKNMVILAINSKQISQDLCAHLNIHPGKKSDVVCFPKLIKEDLGWAFIRGYFEADGHICKTQGSRTQPRCEITSNSSQMLLAIKSFVKIPCFINGAVIYWYGTNALDFLGKIYNNPKFRLRRKYELYLDWCTWVPALQGKFGKTEHFSWAGTSKNAIAPTKSRVSDSGYDVTVIEKVKTEGFIEYYNTGIKIKPCHGIYFMLVARSSTCKTGYMLANSLGVIDRAYSGEIWVPLIKIDKNAPDLPLPYKVAQLIPFPIIHAELVKVEDFEETERGTKGFGSSGTQ